MLIYELDFDGPLAVGEKLAVLANDPVFRASLGVLPAQGLVTKRALTETAGTMMVGAASVLFGADRRADAEMRYQWSSLRRDWRLARIEVPDVELATRQFRDYRERYMGDGQVALWKEELQPLWLGQARSMGLLPESVPGATYLDPSPLQTIYADGTWFRAASEVGKSEKALAKSRAKDPAGARVVDADKRGKAYGYNHVVLFVRGPAPRQRIILAVVRAKDGDELDVVIPAVRELRRQLGDAFTTFVYDGAMEATHHQKLQAMGVGTVNKVKKEKEVDQWIRFLNAPVEEDAKVFTRDFDGCVHDLTFAAGILWEVAEVGGRLVQRRTAEHTDCRRYETADGYRFEVDLSLYCARTRSWHVWTVDPTAIVKVDGQREPINLGSQLRMIPMNDSAFAPTYGIRNDAESSFKHIKHDLDMGNRAGSYCGLFHEVDLLLASSVHNALAWAEHGHRQTVAA